MKLLSALLLTTLAPLPAPAQTPTQTPATADARFDALAEAEYKWRGTLAAADEDTPKDEQRGLPDVGPAMQAAKTKRWTETLAALDAIAPAGLRCGRGGGRQEVLAGEGGRHCRDV